VPNHDTRRFIKKTQPFILPQKTGKGPTNVQKARRSLSTAVHQEGGIVATGRSNPQPLSILYIFSLRGAFQSTGFRAGLTVSINDRLELFEVVQLQELEHLGHAPRLGVRRELRRFERGLPFDLLNRWSNVKVPTVFVEPKRGSTPYTPRERVRCWEEPLSQDGWDPQRYSRRSS
jgi:hypothetical protein